MASYTIAKDLTSFFKSSLNPEDQDNLGKLIEDYFCDEEDITGECSLLNKFMFLNKFMVNDDYPN